MNRIVKTKGRCSTQYFIQRANGSCFTTGVKMALKDAHRAGLINRAPAVNKTAMSN